MKKILSLIKLNWVLSYKFSLNSLLYWLIIFIFLKYRSVSNIAYLGVWLLIGVLGSIFTPFTLIENVEKREGLRFLRSLPLNPFYIYSSLFILSNLSLIIYMLLSAFIINLISGYSIISQAFFIPLIIFNLSVLSIIFVVRINFRDVSSVFILAGIVLVIVLGMAIFFDLWSIGFSDCIQKLTNIANFKFFLISLFFILLLNIIGLKLYKKITY